LWLGWTVAITAVAVCEWFFGVDTALGAGVSAVTVLLYLAAYIVIIVAVPLVFFTLFRFIYSLWLKPWYRAWHINRIRNARYMREVLHRGQRDN
jgi:hypothetical protein